MKPNYTNTTVNPTIGGVERKLAKGRLKKEGGKEVGLMNKGRFKGSWRHFKGELKKHWIQLSDNDLLEAGDNYDKLYRVIQKRYGEQKKEVERWAEDWCERGGWRNNRAAHKY